MKEKIKTTIIIVSVIAVMFLFVRSVGSQTAYIATVIGVVAFSIGYALGDYHRGRD